MRIISLRGTPLSGTLLVTLLAASGPVASADGLRPDVSAIPKTERALRAKLPRRHPILDACVEPHTAKARADAGCADWRSWQRSREAKRPKPGSKAPGHPSQPPKATKFPAPSVAPQSWLDTAKQSVFVAADRLADWALGPEARADAITPILGTLTTWSADDLLLPPDHPPALGVQVYGKYDSTSDTYYFALKAPAGKTIGPHTTLWLDTDRSAATGFKASTSLGADYEIHVHSDSLPYLYAGETLGYVAPVQYAETSDRSQLELAVPTASLGLTSAQPINLIGNVADVDPSAYGNPDRSQWLYFPTVWDSGYYELPDAATLYPERTDPNRRVAMVFCEASQARFWAADATSQTALQRKAYSQLYMALQHQAMMAGIPFDLLSIDALKDVSNIVNYDALVFPYCANIAAGDLDAIAATLAQAVYRYGIGLIAADDLLTNDASGAALPGDSYARMAQLLGLTREGGGGPATSLTMSATSASHPLLRGYEPGEVILEQPGFNWSRYKNLDGQSATALVNQTINGGDTQPAVWATETGGRNVHFSSVELLGNTNLAWQAIQWVLYGDQMPVGLKLGRQNALFAARNDMDQSMLRAPPGGTEPEPADGFVNVDVPLLALLQDWKRAYNFVGSYYLNIGDNPSEGEWTDWSSSGPLYASYVGLGNEIGTHSLTHPHDTNPYDATQHPTGYVPTTDGLPWESWISRQFLDSMTEIATRISPTWQETPARGGAVPGMPESLETAEAILTLGQLDYLTGGYSGVGAGFPGAIGYLIPSSAPLPSEAASRVYFSPTLYFDFTLIDWGLPSGQVPSLPESGPGSGRSPLPATCSESYPDCAESVWPRQYLDQLGHASQPVVVWPWHDYGPTSSSACTTQTVPGTHCYSKAMYTKVLAAAASTGAEFVTLKDAAERIATLKDANLSVDAASAEQVRVTATPSAGASLGKLALQIWPAAGQVIASVDGWYAYSDDKIFLPTAGGSFTAHLGSARSDVTHIAQLPMRAELTSLSGNGTSLDFGLTGEGIVEVQTQGSADGYEISMDGALAAASPCASGATNCIALSFDGFGRHRGSVVKSAPTAAFSPRALSFATQGVGTTSATKPIVVVNEGSGLLTISGVSVEGDFTASSQCSSPLPRGSSCTLDVAFKPSTPGELKGALLVATNDAANPVTTLPLAGEGIAIPIATVSPTSLSFSEQRIGTASQAQGLTLSNAGSASLALTAIRTTGDFGQSNNCGATLAPGTRCGLSVTFAPTTLGTRSGTLELSTNDPESPVLSVALSGQAVGPPAAPGNPRVSCSRYWLFFNRCQVSWTDLSSNEQGFRIQYAKNSSFSSGLQTLVVGSNSTTATTTGLSWLTYYWFRVQAHNALGASSYVLATPSPVRTP